MTEIPADSRAGIRARARAAAIDRIADRLAQGLDDVSDACLVIVERALINDLAGVREFARRPPASCFSQPTGASPHG